MIKTKREKVAKKEMDIDQIQQTYGPEAWLCAIMLPPGNTVKLPGFTGELRITRGIEGIGRFAYTVERVPS